MTTRAPCLAAPGETLTRIPIHRLALPVALAILALLPHLLLPTQGGRAWCGWRPAPASGWRLAWAAARLAALLLARASEAADATWSAPRCSSPPACW